MAERFVLDTSAIFTLTDKEAGARQVEQILDAARAGQCRIEICSISLMELYYVTLRERGEEQAARIIALVKAWPVRWIYPNEKILLQAGKLKASHSLSVADALIAAVAKLHRATVVHKDPEMEALADEVRLLSLPFKKVHGLPS